MRSHCRVCLTFLLVVVNILCLTGNVVGQTNSGFQVKIDQIRTATFPEIQIELSILNSQGFPITSLSKNEISLKEDGLPVEDYEISSLIRDSEPLAIAILIDISGSMKPVANRDPLGDAVGAATDFIEQLNPEDQVAVVTFSDEVQILQELTNKKEAIPALLEGLKPDGATAMNDAVVQALNLLGNRSERRAIVLITDGRPQGDQTYDFDNALNLAAARGIPIYPIGFGDVDKNQLKKLAEMSGGIEQISPDSQELSEAFASILALFRQQYLLSYSSSLPEDHDLHEVAVSVLYQGEEQTASANFTARSPIIISDAFVLYADQEAVENLVIKIDSLNDIEQVEVFMGEELLHTTNEAEMVIPMNIANYAAGQYPIRIWVRDALGFEQEITIRHTIPLQNSIWLYWLIALAGICVLILIVPQSNRRQVINALQSIQKGFLFEMEGLQPGHEWKLSQNLIRMGRKMADNDIRLKGKDASRNHAVIERAKSGFCIRSLKPENPVIVNGVSMERRVLQPGDVIQMGESVFRFDFLD